MGQAIVLSFFIACVAIGTQDTEATALHFVGPSYTFSDFDGDGFSEQLHLSPSLVTLYDPNTDGVFSDPAYEQLFFPSLALDPESFVSGSMYNFQPHLYQNGISLFDDDHTLLLSADLTVSSLQVQGSVGAMNPSFLMNITNFQMGTDYLSGSSVIVDELLLAPGAAMNLTLQFPNSHFGGLIEDGATLQGTYSGSLAPVPEPGTVLLLGAGLLGIVGLGRKRLHK